MSDDDELWCPRRAETTRAFPGPDTWRQEPRMAGASEMATPVCSYCGSLAPERFLELVQAGWLVEPTDKSYKAYLHRPLDAVEIEQRWLQWLSDSVTRAVRQVEEASGKSPEQVEAAMTRRWEHDRPMWTMNCEAKFYFQHLSQAQQNTFIELYNTKSMVMLGRFYVRPYFCAVGPADG